jgi:coenzyme PQQ precursor peptide PqqA
MTRPNMNLHRLFDPPGSVLFHSERHMWTKPEFEVVEVTMEVTAYVARR